jgi:hypothetical protein
VFEKMQPAPMERTITRHRGARTCDGQKTENMGARTCLCRRTTRLGEGYTASNVTQHAQHADVLRATGWRVHVALSLRLPWSQRCDIATCRTAQRHMRMEHATSRLKWKRKVTTFVRRIETWGSEDRVAVLTGRIVKSRQLWRKGLIGKKEKRCKNEREVENATYLLELAKYLLCAP